MPEKRKNPFEDLFKEIYERIEELLKDVEVEDILKNIEESEPFVLGFSMTKGTEGEPELREFGNVFPFSKAVTRERKPLIDVFEMDEEIKVVAEIPGVEKDDIKLDAEGTKLEIKATGGSRNYSEDVFLPSAVDTDSAKASYKNGVLEVVLKKIENKKTNIEVD
ncbi:MAG: archaeal heat shock protein Hsp20 [Halobacteriota archaeon]|nr:archaeal heat shock protein Hsp20 [Halobacteriota archaeon]